MSRLMMMLYSVAATSLMGAGVILVLTLGWVSLKAILAAALIGAVLAVPVSWWVARAIA